MELLDEQITKLRTVNEVESGARLTLGLVALSHFDADHINGIVALLQESSVDTLLLPYLTLPQRLLAARAAGIDAADPLMLFFLNPVRYLLQQDGVDIRSIVLVPGGPGPATESVAAARDQGSNDNGLGAIAFTSAEPEGEDQIADMRFFAASTGIPVKFLMRGAALRLSQLWEFLPYNDAQLATAASAPFRKQVAQLRDRLMAEPSHDTLAAIRSVYDEHFGTSSVRRNAISMFLYVGPTLSPSCTDWGWMALLDPNDSYYQNVRQHHPIKGLGAILCTGDGYLHTANRLNALLQYLGTARVERLNCVQVMHHGASKNWHPGVADAFAPSVSVFCADPLRGPTFHPHAQVVRDFLPYWPIQVDTKRGLSVYSLWNLR